jgi:haloacid dehalogenase-like hydrolase
MDLALFDFDGTITTTDTWTPFMRLAVRPARLAAGQVLLSPVVIGYKLGMISASRGRQVAARVGFQSRPLRNRLCLRRQRRGPRDARAGTPEVLPLGGNRVLGPGDGVRSSSFALTRYGAAGPPSSLGRFGLMEGRVFRPARQQGRAT